MNTLLSFTFVAVCALLWIPSGAHGQTLFLSPSAHEVYEKETFLVDVRADTEGLVINTLRVEIQYDTELLVAKEFLTGDSFINLWLQEPLFSHREGTVVLVGGVREGFSGQGKIASILFEAVTPGQTALSFAQDNELFLHDGTGTQVTPLVLGGTYTIVDKALQGDFSISSRTHPDSLVWERGSTFHVRWDLKEGADYSYLLTQDIAQLPDDTPDVPEGDLRWVGDIEYANLEDGIYYFRVKERVAGGEWSRPVSHRIMIDTIPPSSFSVESGKHEDYFDGNRILSFFAQDQGSGVSHFEVSLIEQTFFGDSEVVWEEATSPYVISEDDAVIGALVKAVDFAGNETTETIFFEEDTSSDILLIVLGILGIIGVGYVFYDIMQRRKRHTSSLS